MRGKFSAALGLVLGAALGMAAGADPGPRTEPYVQEFRDGYIDWGRGVVGAWGRAIAIDGMAPKSIDPRVQRAAEIGGRARLLVIVQEARATSEIRVGDRPDFVEKVSGIVRGAKVVKDRQGRGKFYEMLVEAPLTGVDGISFALFELMVPAKQSGDGGAPAGGSPSPDSTAAEGASPDAPTGVVIDARGTGLEPALLPRILDESGAVLASPETVDRDALRDRGMAAYATSPGSTSWFRDRVGDHPLWVHASYPAGPEPPPQGGIPRAPAPVDEGPLQPRRGPRPYQLKASGASGSLKADVVLGKADADRLEAASVGRNLLKDCRVIVIVDSPVGGVEGVWERSKPSAPAPEAPTASLRPWPGRG